MTKQKRWTLLSVFFVFHFSLLALGMFKKTLPSRFLKDAQYVYGRITGAGGSFGFFSPNVPRALNVEFDIEAADGTHAKTTLQETAGPEVRARLTNMVHLIEKNFRKEQALRALAASLTASIYRRFPDAKTITINAYFITFPNIREYNKGKRGEPVLIYSAKFERKS